MQTCRLPEAPDIGDYDTEEAFPALRFQRPVWVGVAPGDAETMYVVEQGGTIYAFDRRREVVEAEVFLRVPEVTRDGNEEGLLGLAFHPDYAANGRLFVYNSVGRPDCPDDARRCSRISEFRRDPENPRRAQLGSQRVLLEVPQPSSNHNGGDLHFGPDGRLYASLGDGGGAGDRPNNAQNTNNLLGTILRIDVDEVPEGATYGIPPGNPFADGVGGRPEIWAWGLRNVWRMAFDPSTGLLWAGDVGQGAFEEIDVIVSGNYGWRGREGFVCFDDPLCDGDYIPPVHAYPRGEGTSVTGGLVYRGARLPALWGAYVFGDYGSGAVWALVEGEAVRLTSVGAGAVTAFGRDHDGSLYVASFRARGILRLVRREPVAGAQIPELLSETGCFADTAAHTVAPGLVPYEVNVALWSDGARKLRFAALPAGERARYRGADGFEMPRGTVLLKTFLAPGGRRIETRMLTRQAGGWRGFTWRWNDAQDDARLVVGGLDERVDDLDWRYPSEVECDQCHTDAAGFTLGWRARQLAGLFERDGVVYEQLAALQARGYVEGVPEAPPAFPRLDDEEAPVPDRARAYLDVNCANCHRPEGPTNSSIDLRARRPLADAGVCDVEPELGALGLLDARVIAPGAPARSVLLQRMARRGPAQMPPLGTARPDLDALDLVEAWIGALACP